MNRPDLTKCPKFVRKWIGIVLNYVDSKTPLSGPGIIFSDGADGNGRTATINFPVAGNIGQSGNVDFEILVIDATTIRIAFGTVQDFTVGGTNWTPTGMSPGDDPPYTFTVSAAGYAWLDVTYNTTSPYNITAVSLDSGATVPTNTLGESFVTLGSWGWSGTEITTITGAIGSQGYQFCPATGLAVFGPV